jgi:exocyst complex component 8
VSAFRCACGTKSDVYPDVAAVLADASEEDIYNYQQDLKKIKNRTSTDLQHNVYQNRTQFIKISKEAEKLKGEMRTLRTLMSDLTGTLNQTTSSASSTNGDAAITRKASNRSSVANLEALWNTHLQTLWKRVEGSQKYLPAIPGRHIVHESGRWVELNAATWKARRRVHLILLNDHLLVASEKKRNDSNQQAKDATQKQSQNQVQLVAQRCWPLQDVQMADISTKSSGPDGKGTSNAINVRVGSESFTFATGSQEVNEKATLLTTFRKVVEELRRTLDAETEERAKARDSVNYLATRDGSLLRRPGLLGSLSNGPGTRSSFMIDVDGKQQSIRWVESQIDELDIDIALQRFEEAVSKVERLRKLAKGIKSNQVAQDIINVKIDERAATLAGSLIGTLTDTNSWKDASRQNVDWLVRLGYEDRAREAYLGARSTIIKKRSR